MPSALFLAMQTVQYIQPQHHAKLGTAELLVIDEAAAIPLPLVRAMLGPYLVFLCSTVNGYEGATHFRLLLLMRTARHASFHLSSHSLPLSIMHTQGPRHWSMMHHLMSQSSSLIFHSSTAILNKVPQHPFPGSSPQCSSGTLAVVKFTLWLCRHGPQPVSEAAAAAAG